MEQILPVFIGAVLGYILGHASFQVLYWAREKLACRKENMRMDALAQVYNDIIKERFPRIKCIGGPEESIVALNVTNDVREKFSKFIIDDLSEELRKRGHEFRGVLTLNPECSMSMYFDEYRALFSTLGNK